MEDFDVNFPMLRVNPDGIASLKLNLAADRASKGVWNDSKPVDFLRLKRNLKKSFSDIDKAENTVPIRDAIHLNGEPALIFSEDEIEKLSEPYRFSLIGKISGNRSDFNRSKMSESFTKLGLCGGFDIRYLPRGYMLLHLSVEEDFTRLWTKGVLYVGRLTIRLSKWTPEFEYAESPITPVWIRILDLPAHMFNNASIFSIANSIGKPLKMDEPTADLSRYAFARVCVELNVLKSYPEHVWICWGNYKRALPIVYEKIPEYCTFCKMMGHGLEKCYNPLNKKRVIVKEAAVSNNVTEFQRKTEVLAVEKDGVPTKMSKEGNGFTEPVENDFIAVKNKSNKGKGLLVEKENVPTLTENRFAVLNDHTEDVNIKDIPTKLSWADEVELAEKNGCLNNFEAGSSDLQGANLIKKMPITNDDTSERISVEVTENKTEKKTASEHNQIFHISSDGKEDDSSQSSEGEDKSVEGDVDYNPNISDLELRRKDKKSLVRPKIPQGFYVKESPQCDILQRSKSEENLLSKGLEEKTLTRKSNTIRGVQI